MLRPISGWRVQWPSLGRGCAALWAICSMCVFFAGVSVGDALWPAWLLGRGWNVDLGRSTTRALSPAASLQRLRAKILLVMTWGSAAWHPRADLIGQDLACVDTGTATCFPLAGPGYRVMIRGRVARVHTLPPLRVPATRPLRGLRRANRILWPNIYSTATHAVSHCLWGCVRGWAIAGGAADGGGGGARLVKRVATGLAHF